MSKLKLTTEEMRKLAASGLEPNKQYAVNHEGCPAGLDTRGRLSYKLSDDTRLLLAHCFNCGRSGVLGLKSRFTRLSETPHESVRLDFTLFDTWSIVYSMANTVEQDVEQWPTKHFLSCWEEFEDAEKFGIRDTGAYYMIPRGNVPNDITGFDIRSKLKKEYLRVVSPLYKDDSKLLVYNKDNSRIGVVCEDPISAMKISLAGYAGVALCGTNLCTEDALKLSMLFDKVVVWLDNDAQNIMEAAQTAVSRLTMYMDNVYIVRNLNDPKNYILKGIQKEVTRLVNQYV